jgi:hypothetical protein
VGRVKGHHPHDSIEVGVIEGCPLTGDVPIVALAETLVASPQAVGPQRGVFHRVAIQQEGVGVGVGVGEVQHQPAGLITTGPVRVGHRMVWTHPGHLEQMAQVVALRPLWRAQLGLVEVAGDGAAQWQHIGGRPREWMAPAIEGCLRRIRTR